MNKFVKKGNYFPIEIEEFPLKDRTILEGHAKLIAALPENVQVVIKLIYERITELENEAAALRQIVINMERAYTEMKDARDE